MIRYNRPLSRISIIIVVVIITFSRFLFHSFSFYYYYFFIVVYFYVILAESPVARLNSRSYQPESVGGNSTKSRKVSNASNAAA
jgi:hypothetical protein